VLPATPALTATQALREPTANPARTGQMAAAALLERRVLKAPPELREPKERQAGRQIAKPPNL